MNERIGKLRLQACKWASENVPIGEYENASDEKFAELIVKECVAICEDTDGEHIADAKWGRRCCALEIKQHFGVEE